MNAVKLFIILSLLMGTMIISTARAENETKIATVDLSRLFDEYYKTKEYDKVLEEKSKAFEKERNDKIEKIREAQGKLELLAEDKKAPVQQDVDKMKNELLEYDRQKKADLTKERNEKIREILLEIEKIVSDYATGQGFTMIINDRVLIYGDKSLDITEPILKKLNENQPKK